MDGHELAPGHKKSSIEIVIVKRHSTPSGVGSTMGLSDLSTASLNLKGTPVQEGP
jgi:hypothetical protein